MNERIIENFVNSTCTISMPIDVSELSDYMLSNAVRVKECQACFIEGIEAEDVSKPYSRYVFHKYVINPQLIKFEGCRTFSYVPYMYFAYLYTKPFEFTYRIGDKIVTENGIMVFRFSCRPGGGSDVNFVVDGYAFEIRCYFFGSENMEKIRKVYGQRLHISSDSFEITLPGRGEYKKFSHNEGGKVYLQNSGSLTKSAF